MDVTFWGVRGSIPTSSHETVRYGGHTSCVCVRVEGGPPLVFDMGTGARLLGKALRAEGVEKVYVAMSHTHVDHMMGLPYFEPIFDLSCDVHMGFPASSSAEARERVGRYLNGIFHPLNLADLGSNLKFHGVPSGETIRVGPYTLSTIRLVHPGGTLGYRVSVGERSMCYLTDTGPLAQPGEGLMAGKGPTKMEAELLDFASQTDLMVMDTCFDQDQYHHHLSWGHAYPEYAVAVGEAAGVKEVVLFHHNPDASDDSLDALAKKWAAHSSPTVSLAKEGRVVSLEG